jgi:hypothetical protein
MRWSLLKKPSNLSVEEKQAILELESEDGGFVHRFRNIIRQVANIFEGVFFLQRRRVREKSTN